MRARKRSHYRLSRPAPANYIDNAHPVADGIQSVTIATVQTSGPGTFKMVDCSLNGVRVGLLLDLGAKVSILSSKVYFDALAAQPPLQPQTIALRTYSGSSISCLGCVTLSVELNGSVIRDFRFYVSEQGVSIMGVDLFDAFGGSVLLGGDRFVSSSSSAAMSRKSVCVTAVDSGRSTVSLEQFPVLLKKSGRLTGFVHRPYDRRVS